MTRPRMLHVITGLGTGGAERALTGLLQGGLADRFECHVVSLGAGDRYVDAVRRAGARAYLLDLRGRPYASIAELCRSVRAIRPDIIQGWMYHGNLVASACHKLFVPRARLLWNVRQCLDDITRERPGTAAAIRIGRRMSSGVDLILYNSRKSADQHQAFGFDLRKAKVIHNGFEPHRYVERPVVRARLRAQWGLADHIPVIGNFARFHPMKDHASLVAAAQLVLADLPDAAFVLAGAGVDRQALALDRLPADMADRFILLGERRDIPDLLQAIDIYVSSSSSESLPNVVGEAMTAGKPVVATDVGDTALLVETTGAIVPAGAPDALASDILAMIANPALRSSLGHAARARIIDHYSASRVVDHYIDLYQQQLDDIEERR
jgi:glycosyltransferase involved in cell wall biosynthesis